MRISPEVQTVDEMVSSRDRDKVRSVFSLNIWAAYETFSWPILAASPKGICRASITHELPCLLHEPMVKRAGISGQGACLQAQFFAGFAP